MNNETNPKKNSKIILVLLIPITLLILTVIASSFLSQEENAAPGGWTPTTEQTAFTEPISTEPISTEPRSTGLAATDPHHTTESHSVPIQEETQTTSVEGPEEPQNTQTAITHPTEMQNPISVPQQAEAEYENWLAAAMVVCVSIEYPDFGLEGIYAASATCLDDKFSSDGAYIIFSSGGNRIAIHAKALENERAETGTTDISTEVIGFATFDQVDPAKVDVASLDEIPPEELSDLISQSLLVSIYTH